MVFFPAVNDDLPRKILVNLKTEAHETCPW